MQASPQRHPPQQPLLPGTTGVIKGDVSWLVLVLLVVLVWLIWFVSLVALCCCFLCNPLVDDDDDVGLVALTAVEVVVVPDVVVFVGVDRGARRPGGE